METKTNQYIENLQEQEWENQKSRLIEKEKTVVFLGNLLRNSLLGLLTILVFLVVKLISKSL